MTAEEYWFGDPAMLYNYQNAFNLRQKYDLQMSWTQGAYFKSALASTQLWTVQPIKSEDWRKMPKYADNPVKDDEKPKAMSKERRELIEKARQRLQALGLLEKD